MINLIVTGTIGLDTIETPFGKEEEILGGSGSYAVCAASFFAKPGLVAIVGRDMPEKNLAVFRKRKVDLQGLAYCQNTFRWSGFYEYDMNEAKTLKTVVNDATTAGESLPEAYRSVGYLLLGNNDPETQLKVLEQMTARKFVAIDTMNFWITTKPEALKKVLRKVDLIVMNDGEARQFCDTPNIIKAGKALLEYGPKYVIIKKGENGAILFAQEGGFFSAPAFPLEELRDPTGAGDSFAGGMMGYLASHDDTSYATVRRSVIYGSTIASFCVEQFGLNYLKNISRAEIAERYKRFKEIRTF